MADDRHVETEKSPHLGNAVTDRHEIRQGDAKALSRPRAAAMRPFRQITLTTFY